jgi:hypothetical protein
MKQLFYFSILISFNVCFSQNEKIQWNITEVADMSVLLSRKTSETENKMGTATIVNKDSQYYFITAEHVAKDMDKESVIVFHLANDKPLIVNLTEFTENSKISWINHKSADISILKIKLPRNIDLRERIVLHSFPVEQIYNGKQLPSRSADITYFGYPVIDLELEHFSALSFSSKISSGLITQKRADKNIKSNFFYLNKPSIQGCSGSGVYYSVSNDAMYVGGNKTILIGIMHGTKGDNTGGKLAVITPSYYIFDLLK